MKSSRHRPGRARRLRAALYALGLLAVGVPLIAGCPKVIREPRPDPPRVTCTQGATVCYQGHPWVCDPSGEYSPADRRCDRLGAVCCLARSPYDAGLRHACVPAAACVETATDVDGGVLPVLPAEAGGVQ